MACSCEECLGPRGQNPQHVLAVAGVLPTSEPPPSLRVSPLAAEPAAVPPSFTAYVADLAGEVI